MVQYTIQCTSNVFVFLNSSMETDNCRIYHPELRNGTEEIITIQLWLMRLYNSLQF